MWEDEESRGRVVKIILIIVCVLLVAALGVGVYFVWQNRQAEKETLKTSSSESQAISDQKNQQTVDQVNADYALDMETVQTYLPGIVCWGDKQTGGTEGNVSFASALQDLINENICDLYNFRGTLDYADNVSRVDWTDYTVEIPVVNLGVGEESTNTILGRNGAVPFVLDEDITIPAECEAVELTLRSENGKRVAPLTAGDGGVNPVIIDGIEGTLTLKNSAYSQYYFTRLESGSVTLCEKGTEVITAASDEYLNYIPIVLMGAYGGYDDIAELIEQNKELIEHQVGNNGRYIVLGIYLFADGYSYNSYYYEDYEKEMSKAFGEHFINLREYLVTDAADDAGITLTTSDKNQAYYGTVPNSLRSATGSLDLSAKTYKAIGQVIYDRMEMLGYFDEVTEELGIDDVVTQMKQAQVEKALNGDSDTTYSSSSSTKK